MELHPPISPAPLPKSRRSRRLKIATAITLLFVLTVAIGLWGCVWQGGGNVGPVHANLSKIESSDSSGFSSGISRNNDAHFASRRIWLVPEGNELLLKKVAATLKSELQKDPHIDEIRLADHWENPNAQDPGLVPDLTIRLSLSNLEEKDGLYSRSLKADVHVELSSAIVSSNNSYSDNLSPPTVDITAGGDFHHQSDSVGDGIGTDRYQLTSKHIAEQIAGAIRKNFTKWREDYGEFPDAPSELFPPYRPAQDMEFLDALGAKRLGTGRAFLIYNHSAWRWQDRRPADQILNDIAARLKAKGWREIDRSSKDETIPRLRMAKNSKMIHVFLEEPPTIFPAPGSIVPVTPAPPTGPTFCLLYNDRVSESEWTAIWDQLVRENKWRQTARLLSSGLPYTLRAQYISLLEPLPDKSAEEWLVLAEHYQSAKSKDKALHALARAAALSNIEHLHDSPLAGRISDLAKKLGDEKLPARLPDEKLLHELGIHELATGDPPLQLSVTLSQPAGAFYRTPKAVYLLSATVELNPDNPKAFVLHAAIKDISNGSSTWTSIGGGENPGPWRATYTSGLNGFSPKIEAQQSSPTTFTLTLSPTRL